MFTYHWNTEAQAQINKNAQEVNILQSGRTCSLIQLNEVKEGESEWTERGGKKALKTISYDLASMR